MKNKILFIVAVFIAHSSTTIFSQYSLEKYVVSNGGTNIKTGEFSINSSLGQSIIGVGTNSYYHSISGFWYQVNAYVTDVNREINNLPTKYSLEQNFPNPFNPTTNIQYSISVAASNVAKGQLVTLKVFDILGREVATLVNEKQKPGIYKLQFHAENLTSGVYIYRIIAGNFIQCKKLLLMK